MSTQNKTDLRSQLAKARDDWFEGEQGQRCMRPDILWSVGQTQFLKNRLETAFLAGASWAEKKRKESDDIIRNRATES